MIYTKILTLRTAGELDIHDITREVEKAVRGSGIKDGICLVFGKGSTIGVILNENDYSLLKDLKETLRTLVPAREYSHPENARSHLRSMVIGNQVCLPVEDGRLQTGTWQQIMVVELDTRPRQREIIIKIVGNS